MYDKEDLIHSKYYDRMYEQYCKIVDACEDMDAAEKEDQKYYIMLYFYWLENFAMLTTPKLHELHLHRMDFARWFTSGENDIGLEVKHMTVTRHLDTLVPAS